MKVLKRRILIPIQADNSTRMCSADCWSRTEGEEAGGVSIPEET